MYSNKNSNDKYKFSEVKRCSTINSLFNFILSAQSLTRRHRSDAVCLMIPDSIIYENGEPIVWYHSTRDGILVKKSRKFLQPDVLCSCLQREYDITSLRQNDDLDIAALFISRNDSNQNRKLSSSNIDNSNHNVEYFNNDMLRTFVFVQAQEMKISGILQRFVIPSTHNNHNLRANSAGSRCIVTQCYNSMNLSSKHETMVDRAATFSNPRLNQLCTVEELSDDDQVAIQVKKAVKSLSQQIQKVSKLINNKLIRMDVFFKRGPQEQLYLLYCDCIQFQGMDMNDANDFSFGHQDNILVPIIKSKHAVHDAHFLNKTSEKKFTEKQLLDIQKRQMEFTCPSCNQTSKRQYGRQRFYILIGSIIDKFNETIDRDSKIPPILMAAFRKMSLKEYHHLRNHAPFRQRTVDLCGNCVSKFYKTKSYASTNDSPYATKTKRFQTNRPSIEEKKRLHNELVEEELAKAKNIDTPKDKKQPPKVPFNIYLSKKQQKQSKNKVLTKSDREKAIKRLTTPLRHHKSKSKLKTQNNNDNNDNTSKNDKRPKSAFVNGDKQKPRKSYTHQHTFSRPLTANIILDDNNDLTHQSRPSSSYSYTVHYRRRKSPPKVSNVPTTALVSTLDHVWHGANIGRKMRYHQERIKKLIETKKKNQYKY